MGKKPHLDFEWRRALDGSEELYTQNECYSPPEQKFTLAQIREWLLGELPITTELFSASENGQTIFPLKEQVICPHLSEVFFEKCKLHFNLSYIIQNNQLIYIGKDFKICQGEQILIKYFFNSKP